MKRWLGVLVLTLCLWSEVSLALQGGDFAPPVVVLDHQGVERSIDFTEKPIMLILFI